MVCVGLQPDAPGIGIYNLKWYKTARGRVWA